MARSRPGLRARLVLALFATAAITLAVAALALLPPLEQRLRDEAAQTLVLRGEAARSGFERLEDAQLEHPRVGASRPRAALGGSPLAAPALDGPQLVGPSLDQLTHDLARSTGAQVVLLGERGVVDDTDPDAPWSLADARGVMITRVGQHSVQDGVARAALPLTIDGRQYVLALRRRLGDVGRTVAVVETAFVGAALAGLLLALLAGVLLSGRMLRRLRALHDAVEGERTPPPDGHRDELGRLSRAFAELQERLARQERDRRAFVATASHELRTPLASLQSLLELAVDELADDGADVGAVRADVEEALAQSRRLGGLSRGLLDLSRLDADVPPREEPLELGELTRAVSAEFRARETAAPDRPRVVPPAAPCWALGDPDGVARIVRLLIDNALRHTADGTRIDVCAERRGDVVVARVLDDGAGVAPGDEEAIFERFRRGEVSAAPGFGLGLAIGRELARRMGGELALERGAAAPGEPRGARFALALPAAPVEQVGEPPAAPGRDAPETGLSSFAATPALALAARDRWHPSDPQRR